MNLATKFKAASLRHLATHPLLKNSIWMLAGQGTRLALQALYFVLIARALGAEQYGAFASALALTGIAVPFAGIGFGNLLVQNVARKRDLLPVYWANAIAIALLSGSVLTIAFVATVHILLPGIPALIIACVGIADLLLNRWLEIAGQVFQALENLKTTAHIYVAQSVCRVIAAAALFASLHHATAGQWSVCYLLSSLVATIYAVVLVQRTEPSMKLELHRVPRELREGLHFSIGLSAQSIYNNIDKTLLARMASLSAAGFYAAAYRIVEFSFLPISSVLAAGYARFFQKGQDGLAATVQYARGLLKKALFYSVAVAVLMWLSAPLLPKILGHDFGSSVIVMRWLAPLPVLKAFSYFAADSLTGSGRQGLRSAIQLAVALLNTLLTIWWIRQSGWLGAVWASLVSDAALGLALWIAIAILLGSTVKKSEIAVHV